MHHHPLVAVTLTLNGATLRQQARLHDSGSEWRRGSSSQAVGYRGAHLALERALRHWIAQTELRPRIGVTNHYQAFDMGPPLDYHDGKCSCAVRVGLSLACAFTFGCVGGVRACVPCVTKVRDQCHLHV